MMNPNVSRVLAIIPRTVTRIALVVLAFLSYPSAANAQVEWRISVKVFLDETGQRLCLLEPDDCKYDDCCYDTDDEIREMFKGPDSTLAILNERGITIGDIEILELDSDNLPPVPEDLPVHYYCEESGDDDGPCHPDDDDPCPGDGVCVPREGPYYWYHAWVREGYVTRTLRDYAHADARFRYDSEAVNVYLFPAYFGGRCACDPWVGPDPDAILVVGHGKNRTVPSHELGHFMGLCHTQGCPCGNCETPQCEGGANDGDACTGDADCPGGTCIFPEPECNTEPGDDHMADTLPDLQCWEPDDISRDSFGVDYDQAAPSQQEQVDNVWYNVISYHGNSPPRLTSDQLDRMMDVSGTTWFSITERCTFFVDGDPDVPPAMTGHMNCSRGGPRPDLDGNGYPDTQLDGSSSNPLSTVASALAEAGAGDIVMVRGGYYDEPLMIDQRIFLRASDGDAVIGMTAP